MLEIKNLAGELIFVAPRPDMFHQNFRGIVLRFADLRKLDMEASNFEGADFTGACLAGARFNNSKLCNATLDYCDLTGACFSGADLTGASLLGSNLSLDKRALRRLADVKGLDLIALGEANGVLHEEYLRFLHAERKNGFRYLCHLKAALAAEPAPQTEAEMCRAFYAVVREGHE